MLEIQIEKLDKPEDGAIVRLTGQFGPETLMKFEQHLERLRTKGILYYLFELSGLDYLSSAAVCYLVELSEHCAKQNGKVVLASAGERVRAVLELLGVEYLLPIFDGPEDAARHLRGEAVAAPSKKKPAPGASTSRTAAPGLRVRREPLNRYGAVLFELEGNITADTVSPLMDEVSRLREDKTPSVVLDMSKVHHVSSSGLLFAAEIKGLVEERKGALLLCGPNPAVRTVFQKLFPGALTIVKDLEEALRRLGSQ